MTVAAHTQLCQKGGGGHTGLHLHVSLQQTFGKGQK